MPSKLVLVKHAQPILDPAVPPSGWRLGADGESQAKRLAAVLQRFSPFALASSTEPKAYRTAEIVGDAFGLQVKAINGLEEFDRPALPVMTLAERERVNAAIFEDLSKVVLGRESGAQALSRFAAAVNTAIDVVAGIETVVAVTHGTVISLFAAAHNSVDVLALWKRLECPSLVVLTVPEFRLVRVEENPLRETATW